MSDLAAITYALMRLQGELEDLAVGGLRVAGPERLPVLESMKAEFEEAGAAHLARRLAILAEAIRSESRNAAAALTRTQASLRVFERLLTLEVVSTRLKGAVADAHAGAEGNEAEHEP